MANERFSSLKYPYHKAHQPLNAAFPSLFKFAEFKRLLQWSQWEKITKYILVLYDRNTDLLHEFQSDLKARKEAAAIEAGYVKDRNGDWPDDIQGMMDIKNKAVYDAILCFLKIQNHSVWTNIVVTEQELEEFQKLRFWSIDTGTRKKPKKKKKAKEGEEIESDDEEQQGVAQTDVYDAAKKKDILMEACNERIKVLKNLYQEFYGDNQSDLKNAEFEEMISPENSSRILEQMEKTVIVQKSIEEINETHPDLITKEEVEYVQANS